MASTKESGSVSSPSTPIVDRKQTQPLGLRPGQHSINTCLNITCDNHKDKKAAINLSGDFKIQYRDGTNLAKWEEMKSCELVGCQLHSDITQNDATTLLCIGALQSALGNGAQLKFKLSCGHEVTPECSTCSDHSPKASQAEAEAVAAAPLTQNDKQSTGDESVSTDASKATNALKISTDIPGDESSSVKPAEAVVETEEAEVEEPPFTLWLPFHRVPKKAAIAPEPVKQEESVDKVQSDAAKTSTESVAPLQETKEEEAKAKAAETAEDTSIPKEKLTKEAKALRAAALKEKREAIQKAHDDEVNDLMEEIEHQREVLRSRRDQKKQKERLAELRQRLQRLCQKEADNDYDTSDSESEEESDETSNENKGDGSNNEDDSNTSDESSLNTTEEDTTKELEPEDPGAWPIVASKAKEEWEKQKRDRNESNPYLDQIMEIIGMESVKSKMLEMKNLIDTARRQDADPAKERFNTIFTGNPGTGKTKISRIYANFLASMDLVDDNFTSTSGAKLVYDGVQEVKNMINMIDSRGVILIDDAHQLRPNNSSTGRKALDFITSEMDRLQGEVIFIFNGYGKDMESLLGHNQSLQSRIPFTIKFDDYEDTEIHQILVKQLHDKFGGKMCIEKGERGIYMRILARRIGRGRGSPSFGNAREAENAVVRMLFRQAVRIEEARKENRETDEMLLTMHDIIGAPPTTALEQSKAWAGLQEMVGLQSVKESLHALVHRLQINYNRELLEKPVVECSLNRIFLGNPGTGKTTVAKFYGQIMVDIGLLSNGEVVVKNPSDFVGEYLGESENITKGILAASRGKVLIIDEAYGLSDKSDESNDHCSGNIFKTAIVDTLVANIQGTINEDRVVLLLGYRDRMERMFQAVNPGLSRRFPMSAAFEFDDFTDSELREILEVKLKTQGYTASDRAKEVAMEILTRARSHRNFGNAGEIDILLNKAKELQQGRLATVAVTGEYDPLLLEAQDMDPDFDRASTSEARIRDLFQDFVGADPIVERLVGYSRMAQSTKALDIDPRTHIPFNYLFTGPPGTGKTTTAKRIGQVFYDMGLLATNQVYECSASDLIGEFKGHTGPKTQKVFQRALGKVLFIDEAYRLNDGDFGKEALVEMLNILTKEAYKNKVITILAGYKDEINGLLKVNPGLSSRFPEVIQFASLSAKQCHELFLHRLREHKIDTSAVEGPGTGRVTDRLTGSFERLAHLPDWGNARDIETLAKCVLGRMLKDSSSGLSEKPTLLVKEEALGAELDAMIKEREERAGDTCAVSHIYL